MPYVERVTKSGEYDRDREVLYQQIQKERYQQRG